MIQSRQTAKEFKVLLFNTNNSIQHYSFVCAQLNDSKYCYISLTIKHQSFLYTQSNDQKVPFLTIQFHMGQLFAHSLNTRVL